MLKIAITGGIGSGKTAVSDYLENKGYSIIDADKVSHEITAPGGRAIAEIERIFGREYITSNGSMDREKMRSLVYSDANAKKLLEECTIRVIIDEIENRTASLEQSGEKAIFVVAPLLFEQGSYDGYDAIWLVVTDAKTRLKRVSVRDNIDDETIIKIMDSQLSDETKRSLATDIIENNSDLENLYNQVDTLLKKYYKTIK